VSIGFTKLDNSKLQYSESEVIIEQIDNIVFKGNYNGQLVAIKRIKNSLVEKNYLHREVTIMSTISHPNVATCLAADITTSNKYSYLIFPYYENGTLEKVMNREFSLLNMFTKCLIARDIASGMCYLSMCGIIYRTLAPNYVYIDKNYRAIIGDYGFARIVQPGKRMSTAIGFPIYMAPELYNGETINYGSEIDVYSFGILLWELLSEQRPYADLNINNISDLISRVAKGSRPLIEENLIFHDLITQCWSSNPMSRPNFEEVLQVTSNRSIITNLDY